MLPKTHRWVPRATRLSLVTSPSLRSRGSWETSFHIPATYTSGANSSHQQPETEASKIHPTSLFAQSGGAE